MSESTLMLYEEARKLLKQCLYELANHNGEYSYVTDPAFLEELASALGLGDYKRIDWDKLGIKPKGHYMNYLSTARIEK